MMQGCIKLKAPDGTVRVVKAGKQYALLPGERMIGVDLDCGTPVNRAPSPYDERKRLLDELNGELGSGAGDWVKSFASPIARLLNKQACMGCEVRKVILNAYAKLKAKHGMVEALRMIKDLEVQATTGGDHVEILTQLKGWLDA